MEITVVTLYVSLPEPWCADMWANIGCKLDVSVKVFLFEINV